MEPYRPFYTAFLKLENAFISGNEHTMTCPFHDDTHASFSVNLKKGVWHCHAGDCSSGSGGGPLQFLENLHPSTPRAEHYKTVRSFLSKDLAEPIRETKVADLKNFPYTETDIETYQENLKNHPRGMPYLCNDLGLSPEVIKEMRIGLKEGRFTMPIYVDNQLVNVRSYAAKPVGNSPKMKGVPNFNMMRLYPYDKLHEADDVWIMEGEKDMLRARSQGLDAFTVTGGAGSFNVEWLELFRGKTVHICYDIDKVGRLGADKIARHLKPYAACLKIVHLPITEPSNGDFSDFLDANHTIKELLEVAEQSEDITKNNTPIESQAILPDKIIETTLDGAVYNSNLYFQRIVMPLRIVGKITAPYMLPASVRISCSKPAKANHCLHCANNTESAIMEFTIDESVFDILKLVNCSDKQQLLAFKEMCGIPAACKTMKLQPLGQQFLEMIAVAPTIDELDINQVSDTKHMYLLEENLSVNEEFFIEAIVIKDPNNQQIAQLGYKGKPCKSSVQKFEMTDEVREELLIWQVSKIFNESLMTSMRT